MIRNEGSRIPESMAQDFDFTGVLGKRAHSELRNCFSSAVVESKDKSDSGIVEFSLLSNTINLSNHLLTYLANILLHHPRYIQNQGNLPITGNCRTSQTI